MEKIKTIFICIFFVLVTLTNVAHFSFKYSLSKNQEKISSTIDYVKVIEDNNLIPNQSNENTYYSYFERLYKTSCKTSFNLSYLNSVTNEILHVVREKNYNDCSIIILISLDSPDIIFPFQYFW